MATINPATVSDGETIDASDLNNPINTIANEINGNLDNANISASASIEETKLAAGAGMGAWTDYTPTWTAATTNPSIGNGYIGGSYIQIGKTVFFKISVQASTTTSAGSGAYSFGLPVTAADTGYWDTTASVQPPINLGIAFMRNAGIASYWGYSFIDPATDPDVCGVQVGNEATAMATISNSAPFAFANGDNIRIEGSYQAA